MFQWVTMSVMLEPALDQLDRVADENDLLIHEMISAARRAVMSFLDTPAALPRDDRNMTARDPRLLVPRLLLRVYRLPPTALSTLSWANELAAVVRSLPDSAQADCAALRLDDTELAQVDSTVAREIHEGHHYIGSFHDGIHLALIAKGRGGAKPISLVTLSEMDVAALAALISPEASGATLVLSRLYSNYRAPKNTLSLTLARLTAWVRKQHPRVKLLVTYCDPNVGFTGASYRAANWYALGHEQKSSYTYVDGEYTTNREIKRRYGTYNWDRLATLLGGRIARSQIPLMPLCVYARRIKS